MKSGRQVVLALAVFGCASGCVTPRFRGPDASAHAARNLDFLADGKTTREEVLANLGTPTGRFEGDRIVTYSLTYGPAGWTTTRSLAKPCGAFTKPYPPDLVRDTGSLVLVFGADGVLARHSMVVSK